MKEEKGGREVKRRRGKGRMKWKAGGEGQPSRPPSRRGWREKT